MKMSIREALAVQEKQLKHYEGTFPHLREAAQKATVIPEGADLDAPISMIEINKMIPRGVALGWLIGVDL